MVTCKVLLWTLLGVARSVSGTITAAQVQEANAAADNIPVLACISGVVFICVLYTFLAAFHYDPNSSFRTSVLPDYINPPQLKPQ